IGGSLVASSHGDIEVSIQRMQKAAGKAYSASHVKWTLQKGESHEVVAGGHPAAQLDLTLKDKSLRVHLHIMAYPGTSIIQHWMEIENTGTDDFTVQSPSPFFLNLRKAKSKAWTNSWMTGATNDPTQGVMRRAELGKDYHNSITGDRTKKYVPWMAMERGASDSDGLFVSSESLCDWNMTVKSSGSTALLAVNLLSYAGRTLKPGDKVELPPITTGVFTGGLDGMGMRIYDWQYQYLWDYTNPDYYARTQYPVPWVFSCGNLQEQFAYRLAGLDMAGADYIRETGIDMVWDDAGWAKYPTFPVPDNYGSVFNLNYDGPDFSLTQRFLGKMGAKWLAWFCGRPSAGVMDAKVAAWGNFQWRTDGVGGFSPESETAFRSNIQGFLDRNPKASFHTCCGGSAYAHTYGIQRLADLNYLSDFGRGDEVNYYFSYLDTPDKWVDILEPIARKLRYNSETSRHMLSLVPNWGWGVDDKADMELLRRNVMELYHYLLREGVAGRWSYVFHPLVDGDREHYYFQRSNHERTKSLIILKHRAERDVVIYPRGLIPEHEYTVGFDSETGTVIRSGSDLMEKGIQIINQNPGELIYLGLPDRPGALHDKTPSATVGRILKRFETNIGHSGVGLYWTAAGEGNWISYYEVRRNGSVLGKVGIGCYYFDHSEGWNPDSGYSVRAVGGNGIPGPWKDAEIVKGENLSYHGLGGHFGRQGRDGWGAETSSDGKLFAPMEFVPPVKNPAADVDGGTPNQRGGIEGYWETAGDARIGRGWQRASKNVLCVRTWTAQCAGRIRILGRAMKECFRKDLGSEKLHVEILHGINRFWQAELALGDLDGATHDLTLDVKSGDVLRFVLGKGGDPDNDIISWMPKITCDGATGAAAAGNSVVRISCGSTVDYTDKTGNVWSRDHSHDGGAAVSSKGVIENAQPTAGDAELYQTGREGDEFSYRIPVKPGMYSLRLKFAETDTKWFYERPMDVSVNGQRILEGFDVCHAMRSVGNSCEKTFHNIVPDASDCINLRFKGASGPLKKSCKALIRAIEILPGLRPAVRINCGSESSFVDWNTDEWLADAHYEDGATLKSDAEVKLATPTIWDQGLYRTARSGKQIVYKVSLPDGLYTIQLKFAELWLDRPGARPMDISVNGRVVKRGWDPAQAAGELAMATGIRVADVAPGKDGFISVRIVSSGGNDAIIQAIEIL
ncbi:MAG: malectin domain-containing carbohydrate-binding protein, partial [Victivallales bacterium]